MSEDPLQADAVGVVGVDDLVELLPLMRAYCEFYATAPTDADLLALSRALIAEPALEGVQLIARDGSGAPLGFASMFWSWDTTEAARIAIMNDLYVTPEARGAGVAERLIHACAQHARARGAVRLEWETGEVNLRARAVYERVGAVREAWVTYSLQL